MVNAGCFRTFTPVEPRLAPESYLETCCCRFRGATSCHRRRRAFWSARCLDRMRYA
jgi:hypothetical protein